MKRLNMTTTCLVPLVAFQDVLNRDSEPFPAACRSEAEILGAGAAGLASEREIDFNPTLLRSTAVTGRTFPRFAAGRVQFF